MPQLAAALDVPGEATKFAFERPVQSGGAIFLALRVDAITDPPVGSFSDNLLHRYGRRHPFMYVSALPMGISFWLLFCFPSAAFGQIGDLI